MPNGVSRFAFLAPLSLQEHVSQYLVRPRAMDANRNTAGSRNQPATHFLGASTEFEAETTSSYCPSGSETLYSVSLMGSMLSSSDLNLSRACNHATTSGFREGSETVTAERAGMTRFLEIREDGDGGHSGSPYPDKTVVNSIDLAAVEPIIARMEKPVSMKRDFIFSQTNGTIIGGQDKTNNPKAGSNETIFPYTCSQDNEKQKNLFLSQRSLMILVITGIFLGIMSLGSVILLLVHMLSYLGSTQEK